ncbi:hypothetical protein mRhiFer1_008577 [Rhinolophus ferrumequinum]|uniref:Uncharacterized protein n=1 Tax=Rhinolophus ferrumequinum TaxID=59479 RepID=A0A7J7UJR8_RHIFE|nr:hypothetical protein mRhiFer1_008577 [Rhinolophus ferrumequinum]
MQFVGDQGLPKPPPAVEPGCVCPLRSEAGLFSVLRDPTSDGPWLGFPGDPTRWVPDFNSFLDKCPLPEFGDRIAQGEGARGSLKSREKAPATRSQNLADYVSKAATAGKRMVTGSFHPSSKPRGLVLCQSPRSDETNSLSFCCVESLTTLQDRSPPCPFYRRN